MAPISPGKMSGPPRKKKKPTATTKNYRFKGFASRIADIKIDPIHTVQKTHVAEDHSDLSASYFRTALDEWGELNLSATFTSFFNKALPLSEGLPQLLHHARNVFSLLHDHIEKQDPLALEPLLSLVAHLAHDLGSTFKEYFTQTVRLVSDVSASVEDTESIEHCFTCLAWMFKYLSRTLVQDLRPLLEIMVSHFSSKKDYIRRFSAESLAFLLRKAATMYSKKPEPLRLAIAYLFSQLEDKEDIELESFKSALMTLLSESALGVDAQLHSCAVDLFKCTLKVVSNGSTDPTDALAVVDGAIIHLIHQTDATGFQPLLQLITETAMTPPQNKNTHTHMSIRLLLDAIATRKGSRIQEWKAIIQGLIAHLETQDNIFDRDESYAENLLIASALTIQYCPMDKLLPFVKVLVDHVRQKFLPFQFFSFCEIIANLGDKRFRDLVLSNLQQYISAHWASKEDEVCYLLQQLRKNYAITPMPGGAGHWMCPKDWEAHIVKSISSASSSVGVSESVSNYFRLHNAFQFPREPSNRDLLHSLLRSAILSGLDQQDVKFEMPIRLSVGWAFKFYLSLSRNAVLQQWSELSTRILGCRPEYYQLVPFVESCIEILGHDGISITGKDDTEVVELALCDNMLSESFDLREKSLEMLCALGRLQEIPWLTDTSTMLLELLKCPYLPSNVRAISMLIRRLPKQQEVCAESTTLRKLIPLFGLGMLRTYHDATRKDLCVALGQMAASGMAEEIVLDITIQWLQKPGTPEQQGSPKSSLDGEKGKLSPFECSNYLAVKKSSQDTLQRHSISEQNLRKDFEQAHLLRPPTTPVESRTLALQLLLEIPEIAERRSRALSPVFLSVQQGMTNSHVPQSDESSSSYTISPDFVEQPWSLRERKLFLELLGKFVNPRVLYRSRELKDHLLELLTNGNPDVRRLAFIALLNWKDPSLPQYRETLLRIAEEKNATTELALLLDNDEESGSIKSHDRQHVLPILLRLVFGQLVGRAGTHGSQEAKRKSILRLLFRMEEQEVRLFLRIALGRLGDISFVEQAGLSSHLLDRDVISPDQQFGFVRMMQTFQEVLQSQYGTFGKTVLDAVLYCTARACHQINLSDDKENSSAPALVKNIRRSGIQCLTTIFELSRDIEWEPYLPVVFNEIINPRVPKLSIENAQGISGLLRVFSVFSKDPKLVHLLKNNDQLSGNLWAILAVPSARDDVKQFVLEEIIAPLLDIANDTNIVDNKATEILQNDIDFLLKSFAGLLQKQPSKEILLASTKVLPSMAPFAVFSQSTNEVLNLLITLLCEPAQRIPPHVKGQLLAATESLLKSQRKGILPEMNRKLYDVVAGLFNYFKDRPNRSILSELLMTLTADDTELQTAVQICQDLNAISGKKLDEVDYEKQLGAYNAINLLSMTEGPSHQWQPILNNLVFFARTADDFAIRSNAVNCLKQFVVAACQCSNVEVQNLVPNLLQPTFKKGAKENSELIRADFVALYGLVVKHLPNASDLDDLKVLLVGDDEEASFFTNILHIQQHRRLRAIRRLLTEVERGVIKPANISGFFLPLLEKFIDDESADESAQGLKGQSIVATSTLLQWIDWKSFRTIFRQYRTDLNTGSRPEKEAIKLLDNATEALTAAATAPPAEHMTLDNQPHLRSTMPSSEVVSNELRTNFIPTLSKFIRHKDEAEISLRIPAARVVVRLIKLLPAEEVPILVAPIILDLSQILRSRTQESRDAARNALTDIVVLLGPSSLQFVVREMRTALTRGYQLHVLSYTLHTILLRSIDGRQPGDWDYCLEDLVAVIMDDIFGVVGLEKENQDYISTMKEVKSSKSQDSMELLAKSASVKYMRKLIQPFQSLLTGNLTTRQVRKVDELLRRVGVGISHNPIAKSRELLVFSYELIQAFYRQKNGPQEKILTNDEKNRKRFLIQLKSASETATSASSSLQYKIARFALDIVRSTLGKYPDLLTPENVHGFLPVIGDSLIEAQEDVRTSAFRLLSVIIKLPLEEFDQNAVLYVMEAVKVIKDSINTNEESSQAALKLVTAILRERKDVQVRDSDIAYLLHRTMPDVEEPDRQGVTFNFIKAVMARKCQLPEVYELMDKIAVMMITNQSRSGRDAARGVFVHFLLEYAQSQSRYTKQIRFLVKNLEYEFREGRQSVMEAAHTLLQKLHGEMLQDFISTFFIPIVLRMASDDDSGCREMAGALLAQMFRVTDRSQLNTLLEPLRSWLEQADNLSLIKVSMQAWSVYFDASSTNTETEVVAVRKAVARALQKSDTNDENWEVQYQALELFTKIVLSHPALTMTNTQASIWATIREFLTSGHGWLQLSAARLIGNLLSNCSDEANMTKPSLNSKHGLKLDSKAITDLLHDTLRVMKHNEGDIDLAQITMSNLSFLARYVDASKTTYKLKQSSIKDTSDLTDDDMESELDVDLDGAVHPQRASGKSIPAIQYLLDQLALILRREPSKISTAAFTPRVSSLTLLNSLIPQLSLDSLPNTTLTSILTPLSYITDPSIHPPRSGDLTFSTTYEAYTESARLLQEAVQSKVGNAAYVKLLTEVAKVVRERRGQRRSKRAIERVAEPEKAEREKQRKKDIKARRKKAIVDIHRKRRRGDLGF